MADENATHPDDYRQLLALGAHLLRCAANKVPLDTAWQKEPWDGVEGAPLIGLIPGSIGYVVVDVDVDPTGEESMLERRGRVIEVLGSADFSVRTPSGGWHCYYEVDGAGVIPNRKLVVGDLRCDRGFVVLWEDAARHLLTPPRQPRFTRDAFMEAVEPLLKVKAAKGCGKGRGRVVGDRHDGLLARCVAALKNDADPEPAIAKAVKDAKEAGLPFADIDRTVADARAWHARQGGGAGPKAPDPAEGEAVIAEVEAAMRRDAVLPELAPVRRFEGAPVGSSKAEPISQVAVAGIYARRQRGRLRYVHRGKERLEAAQFRRWDGDAGWIRHDSIRTDVMQFGQARYGSWKDGEWHQHPAHGGSSGFASGVMGALKGMDGIGTLPGEWDADPCLLGLPRNRVVHLHTGEVRDAKAEDLISRSTAVEPAEGRGRLTAYLQRRIPDRGQMLRWSIEVAGMLFGFLRSKRIVANVGPPSTFKSAYGQCIQAALDGYAGTLPPHFLVETSRHETHKVNSQVAALEGARLAVYDETPTLRGKPAPFSNEFVRGTGNALQGIDGRSLGKEAMVVRGLSMYATVNFMPALPSGDPAIAERIFWVDWPNTRPDREEYAFLMSREGQAEMLRFLLDWAPFALCVGDDVPLPPSSIAARDAWVAEHEG